MMRKLNPCKRMAAPLAAVLAASWMGVACRSTGTATEPSGAATESSGPGGSVTAIELVAILGPAEPSPRSGESGPTFAAIAALRLAAEKNPSVAEYAATREAALAEVKAATTWQNPTLEVGAGRGTTSGSPSTSGFEYSIGLFQPIEWPGKRGLRQESAKEGVKMAELDEALFRTTLRADVLRAYWTAAGCDGEEESGRRRCELASAELRLAEAQVAAGEVQESALLPLKRAVAQAEQEWLALKTQRLAALNLLRRLCGGSLPEGGWEAITVSGGSMVSQGPAVTLALAKHPGLQRLEVARRRAELAVKQAELAKRPDLTPGLEFNRGVDVTSWAAKLAAAVPFWNRNEAGVAVAQADLKRAEAQLAAKRLEVTAEVEDAVARQAGAAARLAAATTAANTMVETVHSTREMLAAGEIGQTGWLSCQREEEATEREAARAALALVVARIQLEQAIGYGEMK